MTDDIKALADPEGIDWPASFEMQKARAEKAEQALVEMQHARNKAVVDILKLEQERDAYAAVLLKVRLARSSHPACDVHDDDDPVQCGWKRAVQDIDQVLASATNIEKGTSTS